MAMDMELFVQLRNMGLVTYTEYQTMDRDEALAMLEHQNKLLEQVSKQRSAQEERQKRIHELDQMAARYSR